MDKVLEEEIYADCEDRQHEDEEDPRKEPVSFFACFLETDCFPVYLVWFWTLDYRYFFALLSEMPSIILLRNNCFENIFFVLFVLKTDDGFVGIEVLVHDEPLQFLFLVVYLLHERFYFIFL